MVCYAVPLAATVIVSLRRMISGKKSTEGFWLSIMLLGASIFGVVDHMWNGELFLLGSNLIMDLSLGITITAGVFAGWGLIVYRNRATGILRHVEGKDIIKNER